MAKPDNILKLYKKAYRSLPKGKRWKAILSVFLLFLNSFFDLLGLASFLPLLTIMLKDNAVESSKTLSFIYDWFGFDSVNQLMLSIILVIFVFVVLKNIASILILKFQSTFAFYVTKDIMLDLFSYYFEKGYLYFKNNNSTEIFRDIYHTPVRYASALVTGYINLLNELLMMFLIFIGIIIYDYKIIFILGITVIPMFLVFYRITKNKIKRMGDDFNNLYPIITNHVFQSVFSFVDISITRTYRYFYSKLSQTLLPFINININRTVYNYMPSKVIESAVFLSIAVITIYGVYFLPDRQSLASLLGVYALAAYKMMPAINRIMIALNAINENQYVFSIIDQLDGYQEKPEFNQNIPFENKISFENIAFKYPDGDSNILQNYSITIKKGETVGIFGKSGGGKTTLMNILLGLLHPTAGTFKVDDIEITPENVGQWQKKLGYVQQEVFLLDATLAENIAFGLSKEKIDQEKIANAIQMASLKEFVDSLPNGLDTNVGERGAQLSGGQRQRVGIARALYFDSEVLFFDEATSALDPQTELEITESINKLSQEGLTMVIIAHRETSLKHVTRLIEI